MSAAARARALPAPRRLRALTAAAGVVAVLLVAGAALRPAAAAETLRCGRVAPLLAMLDGDLVCDGPGPILRNPGTIVQMNGHTLSTSRACDDASAGAGLLVESTAEGAMILGPGEVRGFATGIAVAGAQRVEIHDVRIADSCVDGLSVFDAAAVRVERLVAHRNGVLPGDGWGVRVTRSDAFEMRASHLFLNGAGARGGAVDWQDCDGCRLVDNHIVANQDVGVRVDTESQDARVQRNVLLDHRRFDVVDEGPDSTFVLNVFERAEGLAPPTTWPLTGSAPPAAPAVVGCGIIQTQAPARGRVTLTCPQDPGLRGLRNSVVAYRLLNIFQPLRPSGAACDPVRLTPADGEHGGRIECTNPGVFPAILHVTCCLN